MSVLSNFENQPRFLGDGWRVSSLHRAGLDGETFQAVVKSIEKDAHSDFHSLLVARHGRLAFEGYFNGYDTGSLHDIRSAGKSMTSTLVGIAIDQGVIPSVDHRVLPYFHGYEPLRDLDDRKASIKIRDLLMMRSGLDADDNDRATPGNEEAMLNSPDWIRYALDLPMSAEPGQKWAYAGVNSMLLAGLLEAATEQPLLEYAMQYLFEPLGIHSLLWQSSPQGTPAGQGFMALSGRDMLKLGQMMLNGGAWNGRTIVSEDWVREVSRCRTLLPDEKHAGYGYHWWCLAMDRNGQKLACFFASGNGGNKIYVVPDLQMVVALASSAYNKPYMHARSHEILKRVIQSVI
ncbi:serine hydrolase [Magnetospira sp. QH-2]|uniref:serine hydrolase domain-containing protein n=1 Tax=Magnetospira sp. (strain QH-2) TaxID=1288970 RepID=UPI0003E81107|nr:serine hydrolase [Magnetospira sp. QH-2]CCQ73718.1 Putative 6-aminohexanoate-dimer hydrolase [Magnetospira sp. QH-2]